MYFFLSLKHTSNTFHEETQFSNISRYSCLSYNRYSRKRVVQRREFRDWLIQITSKKFRHTMRQCFKWGAYLEPRARESESECEIRENENILFIVCSCGEYNKTFVYFPCLTGYAFVVFSQRGSVGRLHSALCQWLLWMWLIEEMSKNFFQIIDTTKIQWFSLSVSYWYLTDIQF